MNRFALRGAIAFSIPVLFVFVFSVVHPAGYYFLAAGPLCGLAGGLAFGRRWGLPIVLGLCFGLIGLMFFKTRDQRYSAISYGPVSSPPFCFGWLAVAPC